MNKTLLILSLCSLIHLIGYGGNPDKKGFLSKNDVFGKRVFVENKGQFNKDSVTGEHVFFVTDDGAEKIYFTSKGVIHKLTKHAKPSEEELEEMEHTKQKKTKEKEVCFVRSHWQNCQSGIVPIPSDKQSHYFTYGGPELNSNTYKKITYKNIYDSIDIEYIIPDDKKLGVKYNIILHPGANPENVKIIYSGNVLGMRLNRQGNVIIKTPAGDLQEEAPKSYYSNNETVKSKFVLKNNILCFRFPKGFDTKRTVIIDPWVASVSTLTFNSYGYDVDYDLAGNVFVYGGSSPCKIAKYNTNGTLLWTFSGEINTNALHWYGSVWAGNFVVTKHNSKCYVGIGVDFGGATIIRLNSGGNYDNFISPIQPSWLECWDLAYDCYTGNVIGLGGGDASNDCAGLLDPITGNLDAVALFSVATVSVAYDVVNYAIDDAGAVFTVHSSRFQPANNKLMRVNAAFTSSVWVSNLGYSVLQEVSNKDNFPNAGAILSNGFNCLAVNSNYLFYYDGYHMAAYNKANGNMIASTVLATPSIGLTSGGIAVDDCNNLYVGGNNIIYSFNFNGTSFNSLSSIPVFTSAISSAAVCDLRLDKINRKLYASGEGFVASFSAIHSLTCTPLTLFCYNPGPVNKLICIGTTATLSPINYANLSNPTYSINPGGVINSSGLFVVSPTVNTSYTTYVIGTNTANTVLTLTSVTNVSVVPKPISNVTSSTYNCMVGNASFNLNLTFSPNINPSPGYTITWSPTPNGVFSPTQTSASANILPGTYIANIKTGNGCSTIASFEISGTNQPTSFLISPPGNVLLNCYNNNTSLKNYLPSNLNYTTTNGSYFQTGTNPTLNFNNGSSTYSVIGQNPNTGCISIQTFVITQNTIMPTSIISPTFQNITCSVTTISNITSNITPAVNVSNIWYSPLGGSLTVTSFSSVYVPGAPGTYTHCAINLDNGCKVYKTFTVASNSGFPTYSLSSPQNFTLGCHSTSVATINFINGSTFPIAGGPISYTLLGPTTSSTLVSGALSGQSTYTVNVPGTWTAVTRDNTSTCDTKVPFSVLLNTVAPTLDALLIPRNILDCDVSCEILEGLSSTPNVSYVWSYPGVMNSDFTNTINVCIKSDNVTNTLIANFTLTIVDNNNTCLTKTVVPIQQNIFPPKAKLALSSNSITCITSSVTITNISTTGIPPNLYPNYKPVVVFEWFGPSPQSSISLSSTYIGYLPGTYTCIVKDLNNGCITSTTTEIADRRVYPPINIPNPPAPFIYDCGATAVTISANIQPLPSYSYSWIPPQDVTVSDQHSYSLSTSGKGIYFIYITDTENGCTSGGVVQVIDGELNAGFIPEFEQGFAPLNVTFTNTSSSSNNNANINTFWHFGNGQTLNTKSANETCNTTFSLAGIYTVTAFVNKGTCQDTTSRIIFVELPSKLEIPNVFSPNNDGINDVFFLKTSGLASIDIKIMDRWGNNVYEVITDKGNIAWDGKTMLGKDASEGVYYYVLNAKGKDGKTYEQKGDITLVR